MPVIKDTKEKQQERIRVFNGHREQITPKVHQEGKMVILQNAGGSASGCMSILKKRSDKCKPEIPKIQVQEKLSIDIAINNETKIITHAIEDNRMGGLPIKVTAKDIRDEKNVADAALLFVATNYLITTPDDSGKSTFNAGVEFKSPEVKTAVDKYLEAHPELLAALPLSPNPKKLQV